MQGRFAWVSLSRGRRAAQVYSVELERLFRQTVVKKHHKIVPQNVEKDILIDLNKCTNDVNKTWDQNTQKN